MSVPCFFGKGVEVFCDRTVDDGLDSCPDRFEQRNDDMLWNVGDYSDDECANGSEGAL